MSWDTAIKAIDYLISESGNTPEVHILLFGGEPLLRMDMIRDLLPYAWQKISNAGKRVNFSMTTNGTLLTENVARFLAKWNVKYIISIDGKQENHDRYRRFPNGEGSWKLITDRLRMLKRYQPWMGARVTPTPETVSGLLEGIKILQAKGVNQFIIGAAHGVNWTTETLNEYSRQMKALCDYYIEQKLAKKHFRLTIFERGSFEEQAK